MYIAYPLRWLAPVTHASIAWAHAPLLSHANITGTAAALAAALAANLAAALAAAAASLAAADLSLL